MKMKTKLLLLLAFAGLTLASCSSDYTVLQSLQSIILTADSSSKTIGQPITFSVSNNEGEVLTQDAVIYVNGAAIEGASFTSETVGSFEIKAAYGEVTSEPITVTFHDGSEINFKKRVLIEDYTGTWCGYCPRVAEGIELVKNQTQDVVPVAIHRASLSPADPSYDPYTFDSTELENIINVPGYPKGMLNRMTQWNFPEPGNINQVIALTQGTNPKLGLALTTSIANGNISVTVNTKFSSNFSNLKLVVYVLENGLVHEQHNYTNYYGGVDLLEDFEHNHVLRACLTPLMGEAITSSETTSGNVYTKTFTTGIPSNVANSGKLEFVAFITDANGNTINVRRAATGETQEFEEQ